MATLASLVVNLQANSAKFNQGLAGAGSAATKFAGVVAKVGVAAGAALGGVAVASTKMAADFQANMSNVGTLLGKEGSGRVKELGEDVKRLAQTTGKDLGDLTGALYQAVSALGDSADSTKILEIAAKGAAAGLADTGSVVDLLAGTMKGYGTVNAEAAQQVSDLAFQTVKLGVTTMPELAANMGKVVPLASTLGVNMESLFGSMATLTGVTGNTAEVSTQLRATIQALINPTDEMGRAMKGVAMDLIEQGKVSGPAVDRFNDLWGAVKRLGAEMQAAGEPTKQQKDRMKELQGGLADAAKAMGPTIVQTLGFGDSLSALGKHADGNNAILAKMFGSVEALNAVLALSGPQAQNFADKTAAMTNAAGASAEAFEIQQQSVNAMMDRLKQTLSVVMVNLGEQFLPKLMELAQWVQDHMPQIQAFFEQAFNGAGVAMAFLGTTVIPALVSAFKVIRDDVIPPLVKAFNFVRDNFDVIGPALAAMALAVIVPAMVAWGAAAAAAAAATIAALAPVLLPIAAIGLAVAGLAYVWRRWKDDIIEITETAVQRLASKWGDLKKTTERVWEGIKQFLVDWWPLLVGALLGPVGVLAGFIYKNWDEIKIRTTEIWNKIITAIKTVVSDAWGTIKSAFAGLWDDIRGWFLGLIDDAKGWAGDMVTGFSDGVKGSFRKASDTVKGFFGGITQKAKETLGIRSPSAVFHAIGNNVTEGLAQGIEGGRGRVSEAITGTVGVLTEQGETFASTGRALGDSLAGGFAETARTRVHEVSSELMEQMKQFAAGLASQGRQGEDIVQDLVRQELRRRGEQVPFSETEIARQVADAQAQLGRSFSTAEIERQIREAQEALDRQRPVAETVQAAAAGTQAAAAGAQAAAVAQAAVPTAESAVEAIRAGDIDRAAKMYAQILDVSMSRAVEFAKDVAQNLPNFDGGGMVPGPVGAPRLAVVHGGERVLTAEQQRGGGVTVIYQQNAPVYGILDFERRVTETIRDAVQGGAFRGVIATP